MIRFTKSVLKSGDNLSVFSVLYFSIATNIFAYLITSRNTGLILWLLISICLVFIIVGFYYQRLYIKYSESKEYALKDIAPETKEPGLSETQNAIYQRLKNEIDGDVLHKFRFLYYLPYLGYVMAIILVINNYFVTDDVLVKPQSPPLPVTHSKSILDAYNEFALCNSLYERQVYFLDSLIKADDINNCNVIDASCCYGRVVGALQSRIKKNIFVYGMDASTDAIRYCINESKIPESDLILGHWLNIDSLIPANRKTKLIYLINNSIPEEKDTSKVQNFFKASYNNLTTNGFLVIDFENIKQINNPLPCNSSRGVKRIVDSLTGKDDTCLVNYFRFDQFQKVSKDSLIFNSSHSKFLMNEINLTDLLKKARFINIRTIKIKGYPFDFMVAQK